MKLWKIIQKYLATILAVVSLAGMASCIPLLMYEAYYGEDATVDLILDFLDISVSPSARLRIQSLHHAPESRRPAGVVNNPVIQEAAPFFGNLSVVTVDPAAPADLFFGLQRQSDCSLTRLDFTASVNNNHTALTVTPVAQTPHYENTIHSSAFSTTTPGVYPNGCADPALGISARPLVFAGIDAGGALRVATIGKGGVLVSSVKGDGTFLAPVTLATDNPPIGLMAGDLNKDGIPDLVSMNSSGLASSITIFFGKADGTYQPGVNVTVPGNATRFGVIDDLDGDGNLDLMVSSGIPGFSFSIFLGNGNGTFKPVQTFTPSVANLDPNLAFITADVNGDHHPDIITAQGAVFLGEGDGVDFTAVAQSGLPANTNGPSTFGPQLLAADFNKDGKVDIATNDGTTIRTYVGKGDGTFTVGHAYATIADSAFMEAVDLDGDGNIDIWSGYSGAGVFGPSGVEAANPLLGNGDGTFQGAQSLPAAFTGTNLADLNGDGHPDLVGTSSIPNGNAPSTLVFTTSLGHANGVFTNGPQLIAPDYVNNVNTHYPISGADSFVVADFDGDQIPDLIYIPAPSEIPVAGYFLATGKGDGSFNTPVFIPAPTMEAPGDIDLNQQITGIRAADFNHDGKQDLIYSFTDTSFNTGVITEGITVQLNNGNGTFGAAALTLTYSSTTPPLFAFNNILGAVGDVNGDNFPDVFLIPPTVILDGTAQHQVELFIAKGDGSFKAPTNLTLTGNMLAPTSFSLSGSPIAIGDLNGDGKADLVASGSSADGTIPEVATALGNGDGTFQPSTVQQYPGFGPMTEPVLADFDGDHKLDLFVSGSGSIVGIFPGVGNGTFQTFSFTNGLVLAPQAILLNVWGPATALDLDGDGKQDLIVGNVVLLNKNGSVPPVKAATTTALGAAPNPATSGQTVMLTATVTSTTAGVITGTVTFFDGANSIGTGSVGAGGVATFETSALSVATHSITAQYGGDANFSGSTSTAVSLVINSAAGKAATSTALGAAPNPAAAGATVTLTATVTSTTAGAITGTVTFLDNGVSIGTGSVGAGGVATLQTSSLSTATHSITASYGGDANFATSTSSAVSLVITAAPAFSLSVAPTSVIVAKGEPGTAVVTVTPMNGFNQQVSFSCSNLPEGVDCEFEPGSVTPDGAPVTTNLSVQLEDKSAARRAKSAGIAMGPRSGEAGRFAVASKRLFVPLLGCEMLVIAGLWRRRKFVGNRTRLQAAYLVVMMLAVATIVAGCAGTPGRHGSATITIGGAAGNGPAVSVPLNITVR